jgi:hypothetical protein
VYAVLKLQRLNAASDQTSHYLESTASVGCDSTVSIACDETPPE